MVILRARLYQALFAFIFYCGACLLVYAGQPIAVDANHASAEPLGKHLLLATETGARLEWHEATRLLNSKMALQGSRKTLTAGIGAPPHWLQLAITNSSDQTISRHLLIDAPWLDQVEVYLLDQDQQLQNHWQTGDSQVFTGRSKMSTGFLFPIELAPGANYVLMRVATPDPLVVPVYLLSDRALEQKATQHYYSYGFSYGYLLALIAFNAMLYFALRDARHLLYAIFLSIFTFTNIAYTGHGFLWFWPESPEWQRWSNPLLMCSFGIAGLVFAVSFLNIQRERHYLYRLVQIVIGATLVLLALALITQQQVLALYLAFVFVLLYALLMLTMGLSVFSSSGAGSRYYIYAAITGIFGVAITAASVWGLIPYTTAGFRAGELGMLIEATLLALALTARIREVHNSQLLAHELASTDPLTGIKNRRAFYVAAPAIWSNSLRYSRPLSAILIDLDHFKALNDSHGHACGDHALKVVAVLLRQQARLSDLLVRWGGEEFLLLLPETRAKEAALFAERLRLLIANQQVRFGDKRLSVSASFGVAERRLSDSSIDQLIERADSALYQAKHAGRNCTRTLTSGEAALKTSDGSLEEDN